MKEEIKSISKDEMIELFKNDLTKVECFVYPTKYFDRYGKFLYKKSWTYPVEYIVTD